MADASRMLQAANTAGKGDPVSSWRHLMLEMLSILYPRRTQLPEVGVRALDVAVAYWRRSEGDPAGLLNAKLEVWSHLNAKHSSAIIGDKEDRLLRALLCVLEASGDSEAASGMAEWFEEMMTTAGG